jgi:hypothetical protein
MRQLLWDALVFFAYLDRYLVTAIMEHPARLAGSILPNKRGLEQCHHCRREKYQMAVGIAVGRMMRFKRATW